MFYQQSGHRFTSYRQDTRLVRLPQDRAMLLLVLILAFLAVPLLADQYLLQVILVPVLVYGLAATGLNLLVGYTGLLSLGTGAFMAVGAVANFKLMTAFPDLNPLFTLMGAGLITALTGAAFGLPSLRIKGFYLAVATLAAQFFIIWLFNKNPWFLNYSPSGQIITPPRNVLGVQVMGPGTDPWASYLFALLVVSVLTYVAMRIVAGPVGRAWQAVRDMDIAAELIGIRLLQTKLSAFAVSSFYVGVAGGLYVSIWFGSADVIDAFEITRSFLILFMIIIGGRGSILGSFLGAAFMVLLPIALKLTFVDVMGLTAAKAKHIEVILVGVLIIFFLIKEPRGLAQLWATAKQRLINWPLAQR